VIFSAARGTFVRRQDHGQTKETACDRL
jgi:hypothetical protein